MTITPAAAAVSPTWLGSTENLVRFGPLLDGARGLREAFAAGSPPQFVAGDFRERGADGPVYSSIKLVRSEGDLYELQRQVSDGRRSIVAADDSIADSEDCFAKAFGGMDPAFDGTPQLQGLEQVIGALLVYFREEIPVVERFARSLMPEVLVSGPHTGGRTLQLQDGAILRAVRPAITSGWLGIPAQPQDSLYDMWASDPAFPIRWDEGLQCIRFGICTWSPKDMQGQFEQGVWSHGPAMRRASFWHRREHGHEFVEAITPNGYLVPETDDYYNPRYGANLVSTYFRAANGPGVTVPDEVKDTMLRLQRSVGNLGRDVRNLPGCRVGVAEKTLLLQELIERDKRLREQYQTQGEFSWKELAEAREAQTEFQKMLDETTARTRSGIDGARALLNGLSALGDATLAGLVADVTIRLERAEAELDRVL